MAIITKAEANQLIKSEITKGFPELASTRIHLIFVAGRSYYYYMATAWLILGYR